MSCLLKDESVKFSALIAYGFLAIVVCSAPGVGVEPEKVYSDDFGTGKRLDWKVIREVRSHTSLTKNPGCLTITTQRGTIHGDEKNDAFSEGTQAKNIYLVDLPLSDDADFVVTLSVKNFEPELFYHQVGLIAYRDDDNYVKWSMEQSNDNPPITKTVLVSERSAQPSHDLITDIQIDGPFALRLERFGTSWICSHSLDGDEFQVVGIKEWPFEPAGKTQRFRVGFLAKNGGNPKAPEIDVQIDRFELKLPAGVTAKVDQ